MGVRWPLCTALFTVYSIFSNRLWVTGHYRQGTPLGLSGGRPGLIPDGFDHFAQASSHAAELRISRRGLSSLQKQGSRLRTPGMGQPRVD